MPLMVVHYGTLSEGFELTKTTTIGRSAECDLVINIDRVSRRHARIQVSSGRLVIEDLGSRNGTWVNGQRIVRPRVLQPGDEIHLSKKIRLTYADQSEASRYRRRQRGPRSIVFRCPGCGAVLKAAPSYAGTKGRCPACGTRSLVPRAGADTAQPLATPPLPQERQRPEPLGAPPLPQDLQRPEPPGIPPRTPPDRPAAEVAAMTTGPGAATDAPGAVRSRAWPAAAAAHPDTAPVDDRQPDPERRVDADARTATVTASGDTAPDAAQTPLAQVDDACPTVRHAEVSWQHELADNGSFVAARRAFDESGTAAPAPAITPCWNTTGDTQATAVTWWDQPLSAACEANVSWRGQFVAEVDFRAALDTVGHRCLTDDTDRADRESDPYRAGEPMAGPDRFERRRLACEDAATASCCPDSPAVGRATPDAGAGGQRIWGLSESRGQIAPQTDQVGPPQAVPVAAVSMNQPAEPREAYSVERNWWDTAVMDNGSYDSLPPDAYLAATAFGLVAPVRPTGALAIGVPRSPSADADAVPSTAVPPAVEEQYVRADADDWDNPFDGLSPAQWLATEADTSDPDTPAPELQTACDICNRSLAEQDDNATSRIACPTCGRQYHLACWQWNRGCLNRECPPVNLPIRPASASTSAPASSALAHRVGQVGFRWRRWLASKEPDYVTGSWDLSLLAASLVAFGLGMISAGVPNALTLLVAVAYKLKYRRRFSSFLFVLIMLVALAGLAAGIAVAAGSATP